MLKDFWKAFKSGTDIRGVAVDGAGYDVNLTNDTIQAMTNGFILWLAKKTAKSPEELTVSVGRDSRISGPAISAVVKETLINAGIYTIDCDLASTPAMFMTTVELDCDGAIQITASHHPYYRNGLKFFTRDGGLESDDITAILEYAQDGEKPERSENGELVETDYMSCYAGNLREFIKKEINSKDDYHHPLKNFKIVVDAGNGVGGFYATDVLEALGAEITGSQFLEPDGMFPYHIPNPEDAKAMEFVCNAVKKYHADLGVIFDTDVDRGGAVDANGKEINRNRLVALAAAIALEGIAGGMIVTDSITSSGLKEFIEKDLKGKHLRFKRGYKNVIDEAVRQNNNNINCPLAIETSGHAAMKENYFLDDGAYLVTKIIIKAVQLRNEGKTLDDIIGNLKEPVESKEFRIKITEKDFRKYGEKVISDLYQYAAQHKEFDVADDNYEGIRVSFDQKNGDGWFLLRLSVHDPIMPLNIESDSEGGVDKIYAKIKPFLEDCEGLETYVKKPAPKKQPEKNAKTKKDVKAETPVKAKEEVKPVETPVKAKEEVKPVETSVKTKEEVKPVETPVKPKEEVKPVETPVKAKEEVKPVETPVKAKEEVKPVETPVKAKEEVKPVETPVKAKEEVKPVTPVKAKEEVKPVETPVKPKEEVKPAETPAKPKKTNANRRNSNRGKSNKNKK